MPSQHCVSSPHLSTSFCGLLKWEVLQYDRWKVAKSDKVPLLEHEITVWRRESGTATTQSNKKT